MPIYEYKCLKCGKVFEAYEKITGEALTRCKFCKGEVERLISSSSFQLKGSGWYVTDYARKSGGPDKSSESGDKPADKTSDKPGDKSGEGSKKPPATPEKSKPKKEE